VLGTLITEGDEGERLCAQLFSSRECAQEAAEQLVAIAMHHGLQGWLLNIENRLKRKHLLHLHHFVAYLRYGCSCYSRYSCSNFVALPQLCLLLRWLAVVHV